MTLAQPEMATERLWGLSVEEIHARYWRACGIHVVRRGDPAPASREASWYLLVDGAEFLLADLRPAIEKMYWAGHELTAIRLSERSSGEAVGRHRILVDAEGRVTGFAPLDGRRRGSRALVTTRWSVAERWRTAESGRGAMREARRSVEEHLRGASRTRGQLFRCSGPEERAVFMRELCRAWDAPAPVIAGVRQLTETVWADEDAAVDEAIPMVGPVWVGAGRRLEGDVEVVGPAVLWDAVDRGARAPEDEADEEAMEDVVMVRAARRAKVHLGHVSRSTWKAKRLLDVAGALVGLALTLPLYPLIMLAIWLEDGSPFFFGHVRETLGGREFKCWKFRSMRRDAEGMKAQLKNEVDGPQFFIKKDPRMTRVGRFLRTTNLDELPQFWNVLVGDMAIVGPRPSPRNENRFCAAWREARLSVRPGITGLWQVERTRAPGVDFQEWVRYDLEYVQRVGVGTDLYIIWRTIYKIIKGDVRGH